MKKRILSALMALLLTATLPAAAFAEDWYLENGDITVNAGDSGQTVTQGANIDVPDSAPVITQQDPGTPTTNTVTIDAAAGAEAKVTLDGVNIDVSGTGDTSQVISGKAAISATGDGDVTIELDNTNTVKSGDLRAGLEKSNDGELTITDTDNNGSLNATGGGFASGIGGGNQRNGSNITIEGGTVKATGGYNAAGIGGGQYGDGSNIIIEGGEITAKGGNYSAGIGGGFTGSGSNITIEGGKVKAKGSYGGAGIGGGYGTYGYGNGNNITITDGEVTALGYNGAGIGGGESGDGNDITITGGKVIANSVGGGEGIGCGSGGSSGNIKVSGDTQLKVKGKNNVTPDTSELLEEGYILYYDSNADIDIDQPTAVIHYGNTEKHEGTLTITPAVEATSNTDGSSIGLKCSCGKINIESQTIHTWENGKCSVCGATQPASAVTQSEDALSSPLYRVTDRDGKNISYKTEQNDGVLTITADADFAVLTGTLSGINTLKAQGVEKIVFVTNGATSTFALADLLAEGSMGNTYKLTHDGATVTFTLGATNADVSSILG